MTVNVAKFRIEINKQNETKIKGRAREPKMRGKNKGKINEYN